MRFSQQGHFKTSNGMVVPAGTVSVYYAGTTTLVPYIYAAKSGGSAITTGQVLSDANGKYVFYVDDKDYSLNQTFKVVFSKSNPDYITQTYDDVVIFPPVPSNIYYPDANAADQGATTNAYSVKSIINTVGSNNAKIILRNGSGSATTSYTIVTALTIPATIEIEYEIGAMFADGGTGLVLTHNATLVGNPMHQIFSGFAAGEVMFSFGAQEIMAHWWGRDTTAVDCAINSICNKTSTNGHGVGTTTNVGGEYGGGTVVLIGLFDFATTSLNITAKSLLLKGMASGYQQTGYGTRILYTGTGIAIALCEDTIEQAYNISMRDFHLYGGGSTGDATGLRVGYSASYATQHAAGNISLDNVTINHFANIGLQINGVNWLAANECHFDYNKIGIYGSENLDSNNVVSFSDCSTAYNSEEGILAFHGEDWIFNNHFSGNNGYEGLKIVSSTNQTRKVDNLVLNGGWFEGNQIDKDRFLGTGYYQILSVGDGAGHWPGRLTFNNVSMRGKLTPSTWIANTAYSATNKECVIPITINGHRYKCTTGGTSGATEPTWNFGGSSTTGDNGIVWTEIGSDWNGNKEFSLQAHEVVINNIAWGSQPGYDGDTQNVPRLVGHIDAKVVHFINEDIEKWDWTSATRIEGNFAGWNKTKYAGQATNAATLTTLFSHTIPANHLSTLESLTATGVGTSSQLQRNLEGGAFNTFYIKAHGTRTGTNDVKTIILKFGGQTIATITGIASNVKDWIIEAVITISDITAGSATAYCSVTAHEGDATSYTGLISDSVILTGITSTSDVIVLLTGQCTNASDTITGLAMNVKTG